MLHEISHAGFSALPRQSSLLMTCPFQHFSAGLEPLSTPWKVSGNEGRFPDSPDTPGGVVSSLIRLETTLELEAQCKRLPSHSNPRVRGKVCGLVGNNEGEGEGKTGSMQRYVDPLSGGPPACIILYFS